MAETEEVVFKVETSNPSIGCPVNSALLWSSRSKDRLSLSAPTRTMTRLISLPPVRVSEGVCVCESESDEYNDKESAPIEKKSIIDKK